MAQRLELRTPITEKFFHEIAKSIKKHALVCVTSVQTLMFSVE